MAKKPQNRQDIQDREYRNPTFLQKLEKKARERGLERASQESYNWFMRTAARHGSEQTRKKIEKDAERKNRTLQRDPGIGNLYLYAYDAKTKDQLPYWDAFPLIMLVDKAEGGWYGLNFHYLPPKERAVLFDNLQSVLNNRRYNNKTKFNISYEMLKETQKYKAFKPCFKRYLGSQLRSRIIKIGPEEWEAVLFMPLAKWRKANAQKVYSDSMKKIRE